MNTGDADAGAPRMDDDRAAFEQLRSAENMIQSAADMLWRHLQGGLRSRDIQPLRQALLRALNDMKRARERLQAAPEAAPDDPGPGAE